MTVRAPLFIVVAAVIGLGLGLALAGCGERAQTADGSARKLDTPAWNVSDAALPAFNAGGWKAGDKTAWEDQLRKRSQAQNDYAR